MVEVDPRADGPIAEVLDARSSGSFMATGRMTPTITVHHTQSHRGGEGDDERDREVMYDDGNLFVSFVMC